MEIKSLMYSYEIAISHPTIKGTVLCNYNCPCTLCQNKWNHVLPKEMLCVDGIHESFFSNDRCLKHASVMKEMLGWYAWIAQLLRLQCQTNLAKCNNEIA